MGPLKKIQKAYAFFSESKLRSIFQTCAGQERKLVRRAASQIWSLRDDTGQKCCIGQTSSDRAADRLILQPNICLDKSWFIEEVFLCKYE